MIKYGLEERNIARLNPILAMNRISAEMTGWYKTTQLDDLGVVELTCEAGVLPVPHGLDADVIFGLTTAFHVQGRPSDHTITLNVSQLCKLIGLSRGGDKYARIQESIERLSIVKFTARSCWGKPGPKGWQWSSLKFGVIDSIREADEADTVADIGRYTAQTVLRIRLNEDLVSSIRNDHTRFINLDFYRRIEFPLARLLYRQLEEYRSLHDCGEQVQIPLLAWGEHLGFREVDKGKPEIKPGIPATKVMKGSRILRSLEAAHEQLVGLDYLREVIVQGSGKQQGICYVFSSNYKRSQPDVKRTTPAQEVNEDVVGILKLYGISAQVAGDLSRSYTSGEVDRAVATLKKMKQANYPIKTESGLLITILKNPEKYSQYTHDTSPIYKTLQAPPSATPEPQMMEPPLESRTQKQAEMALLGALKTTAADKALRIQLIEGFMLHKLTTLNLSELSRMNDHDARLKAQLLLGHTSGG